MADPFPSTPVFRQLMSRYTTASLVNGTPETFKHRIDAFLNLRNAEMEGYVDPTLQRDLSINFHWGHDHDFGSFKQPGRMGERHLNLLAKFHDDFNALPLDLTGKKVLDIGCWTGGTSLLLSAMGASVFAIEEVRKYAEAATFLRDSFGVNNLTIEPRSLYNCDTPDFADRFDLALYCGVLYHVTDPVLSLRIVFNSLNDGGKVLLETMALDNPYRVIAYWGPTDFPNPNEPAGSRTGWNWFVPTPSTIKQMMEDVGFVDVRVTDVENGRAYAVGTRDKHKDMMRAGLSRPTVR